MTRILFALFAALAAIVSFPPLAAQPASPPLEPAALPQGNAHLQPFAQLRYLITSEPELGVDAALARRDEFAALENPWVDFGDQEGAVWLLVAVENSSERGGEWSIDVQRPFADELLVLKLGPEGKRETLLDFDRSMSFDERPVVSQYLVAPLWMEAGERAEILVGLRSATGSWMPLTFATPERIRTAHMQEARVNWLINGAIVALVLIAVLMGRLVGWPLVIAFGAYAALSAAFVANNEGYLHRFVFTETMGVYEPLNLLLLTGMMLSILQFARLFAGLAEHYPRVNRAVQIVQGALLVLGLLSAAFWQFDAMRWLVLWTVPFVALAYFASAVLAWRAQVLGAVPFLAGSAAIVFTVIVMAGVIVTPGKVPMTIALDYYHASVLFESLAFLVAILVRMLAIQAELNRSLAAEVSVTREKLELAQALQDSRNRYDNARAQAETMRSRLASTSHDLQQPLIALRRGLADISRRDPAAAGPLANALDYLKDVTESGLATSVGEADLAGEKPDSGAESFPVNLMLENCASMFRGEAEERGVDLRVHLSALMVRTEPIDAMRALSNLVSNALKHSGGSAMLIGAQDRGDSVLVRVIDNGRGMSADDLAAMSQAGAKGEASEGHGLGLALVHDFASRAGHGVTLRSEPGKGMCVMLSIPKG
ncbi:MAG: sensor histidine kinase [Pseudomonadota bacterium]